MALSNKFGHLVLATGNKSEYAVGYCHAVRRHGRRLRADQGRARRRWSIELARWRNAQAGHGETAADPASASIDAPPSAELRADQLDTDSLPPYDVLDPVIEAYVEQDLGVDEMVAAGFERALAERVVRMVDRAEYKRRQAPPGVKITPKAFGRDRRMPITNRYPG